MLWFYFSFAPFSKSMLFSGCFAFFKVLLPRLHSRLFASCLKMHFCILASSCVAWRFGGWQLFPAVKKKRKKKTHTSPYYFKAATKAEKRNFSCHQRFNPEHTEVHTRLTAEPVCRPALTSFLKLLYIWTCFGADGKKGLFATNSAFFIFFS